MKIVEFLIINLSCNREIALNLLRLNSVQSATCGRSPDRRGGQVATCPYIDLGGIRRSQIGVEERFAYIDWGGGIRRSGDRPGVELQSGDCTQRKGLTFTVYCCLFMVL